MFASSGVAAALITVAAGVLVSAGAARPWSQPIPLRVRVRRGGRFVRRR